MSVIFNPDPGFVCPDLNGKSGIWITIGPTLDVCGSLTWVVELGGFEHPVLGIGVRVAKVLLVTLSALKCI